MRKITLGLRVSWGCGRRLLSALQLHDQVIAFRHAQRSQIQSVRKAAVLCAALACQYEALLMKCNRLTAALRQRDAQADGNARTP